MTERTGGVGGVADWRHTSEVVNMTGVPESTLRRFMKSFSQFIQSKKVKGKRVIHKNSIEVIEHIRDLRNEGLSYAEIEGQLEESTPQTLEATPSYEVKGQASRPMTREDKMLNVLEGLQQSFEKLVERTEQQDELKEEVRELKQQLQEEKEQRKKDNEEMKSEVLKLVEELSQMFYNNK